MFFLGLPLIAASLTLFSLRSWRQPGAARLKKTVDPRVSGEAICSRKRLYLEEGEAAQTPSRQRPLMTRSAIGRPAIAPPSAGVMSSGRQWSIAVRTLATNRF
jgi:hypothetical protein